MYRIRCKRVVFLFSFSNVIVLLDILIYLSSEFGTLDLEGVNTGFFVSQVAQYYFLFDVDDVDSQSTTIY